MVPPFLTLAQDGDEWSASRPGYLTSEERVPVPIGQEAGWAQSQSGHCGTEKNLLPMLGIEPQPVAHRYTD
jgi:hypothetical protein